MSKRCGYCCERDTGHNRVGCPARKEDVANMRKRHADGEYGYYPSLLEQDDRYKSKKARKCSYCRNRHYEWEYDHTRRNCPKLKEDRQNVELQNKEWRTAALSLLKNKGIGPGAIIRDERHGLGIVSQVNWDAMTSLLSNGHGAVHCFFVTFFKSPDRERSFNFIKDETLHRRYWGWEGPNEVLVPATERIIDANLPDGWAEGKTGLDFYFDIKYDGRC
jgi:hypothetical protein